MRGISKREIEEIRARGYLRTGQTVTDGLIDLFYNRILAEEERELMELVFREEPMQEELDRLLEKWDIEIKGAEKSLLLSYIMKLWPGLEFRAYEAPRLRGLLMNLRFKNLKTIAHYGRIGRALNRAGIEPMVIKGGAMRYMRPELPRVMGDIDILVPERDFMRSAEIAESAGYWWKKPEAEAHSIDLHPRDSEEGAVDIHRYVSLETDYEKELLEGLFKRARREVIFGVNSLLPGNEDLLFIALVNLAKNLRNKTSEAGLLFTLFDCKYLIESKPDFDWGIVKEDAAKTKAEVQVNFTIKFIEKISSNILPPGIKGDILFEEETTDYSKGVMYNRFYLEDLRNECRAMKIGMLLRHPAQIKRYIMLKPRYIVLKSIRKHPKLIELFIRDLTRRAYDF